jgi:hypothetical protein
VKQFIKGLSFFRHESLLIAAPYGLVPIVGLG